MISLGASAISPLVTYLNEPLAKRLTSFHPLYFFSAVINCIFLLYRLTLCHYLALI